MNKSIKTMILTSMALIAFAGNSVLCRLALGGGLIDAAGFSTIRMLAGAITLVVLIMVLSSGDNSFKLLFKPSFRQTKGAFYLFAYALLFSWAYLVLDTGSGALILFGSVQLTLLLTSFLTGSRPGLWEWLGVLLAFIGLVYLLLPAWGTPSLNGFLMMALSGLAWGLYTLAGKGSINPLLETSKNFLFTLPAVLLLSLFWFQPELWTHQGILLAMVSGALTSGVGYAIWYAVLPQLSTSQAGVLQLLVPVIAAIGGVVFAGEILTIRLIISSVLVLGGIYLVICNTRK